MILDWYKNFCISSARMMTKIPVIGRLYRPLLRRYEKDFFRTAFVMIWVSWIADLTLRSFLRRTLQDLESKTVTVPLTEEDVERAYQAGCEDTRAALSGS